jgi:CDP-glucose 4,6-dehydratase
MMGPPRGWCGNAMLINSSFWKNKRVLVTGHTGFKGSWLCLWLEALGAEVSGFSLKPAASPNLFAEADVGRDIKNTFADIRDQSSIHDAIATFRPEIVIHMAAQPLVRRSYQDPIETYSTNVMGTVNLLEAVRKFEDVRAVVNVTTDKCYDNKEWIWPYREGEPLGGHDPYSSSKACAELVTQAYRKSFYQDSNTALASARAGNVIGGGDWSDDRLIPDILLGFQEKNPVVIRNPHAIRPWQHVLESLHGYLLLAENLFNEGHSFSEAWNFGPRDEDAKSVGWIMDEMSLRWGEEASWVNDEDDNPHEATYLKLDISKAKQRLGWSPKWNLDQSLDYIVSWHKGWLQKRPARELCLGQIQDFNNN